MINAFGNLPLRVTSHWNRVRRAIRLGVPFIKRSSFRTPASLLVEGRRVPISLPPDDQGVHGDFIVCFLDDDYGLEQVSAPPRTVLDIGANVGFFALAARVHFPSAVIHVYEPNPRTLRYCRENLHQLNIAIHGEALGASHGLVSISDCPTSNQARTGCVTGVGTTVPQISLQTAIQRIGGHVDLAKIDCEGAEWELFDDVEAWEHIDRVRMEYHCCDNHAYADVEQALSRIGFSIQKHVPSGKYGIVWATNERT